MKSVVVIDRASAHRERLERTIRTIGSHDVRGFRNDATALPFLREHGAACVLVDVPFQATSLSSRLSEIKRSAPRSPLVLLTDGDTLNGQARPLPPEAMLSVNKNSSPKILRETLQGVLLGAEHFVALDAQRAEQDSFLRTLVHDLRAPLRNIQQLSELSMESVENNDLADLQELLQAQSTAAASAGRFLEAIGKYAKLNRESLHGPVNLSEAARLARASLSMEIEARNATVHIADMPIVSGDLTDLITLFEALIDNGLRYNTSRRPKVSISHSHSSGIDVVVADNGIGVPNQSLVEIFSPLTRLWAEDAYSGTGMGLAICRRIMDRHGGKITCLSVDGEGAEFQLKFPAPAIVLGS